VTSEQIEVLLGRPLRLLFWAAQGLGLAAKTASYAIIDRKFIQLD
jgi:hypothetical protein